LCRPAATATSSEGKKTRRSAVIRLPLPHSRVWYTLLPRVPNTGVSFAAWHSAHTNSDIATVLARRNEGREGRFPDDMPQDATPNAPPAQSRGEVSRAAALKRDTQSAAPSHEFSAERVRRLANSGVVKNDDGDELATGHLNLLHGAKWNSARTRLRIQQ